MGRVDTVKSCDIKMLICFGLWLAGFVLTTIGFFTEWCGDQGLWDRKHKDWADCAEFSDDCEQMIAIRVLVALGFALLCLAMLSNILLFFNECLPIGLLVIGRAFLFCLAFGGLLIIIGVIVYAEGKVGANCDRESGFVMTTIGACLVLAAAIGITYFGGGGSGIMPA